MKALKKVIFVILSVSIFMTMTGTSTVLADSTIRKGTVRVVVRNSEIDNCADEVVYNGHRYLQAYYFLVGLISSSKDIKSWYHYNDSNASNTYYSSYNGYISFFGGTNKIRLNGEDYKSINPLVYYNHVIYVSIEDIANQLKCNYGFDASKNTIYFY